MGLKTTIDTIMSSAIDDAIAWIGDFQSLIIGIVAIAILFIVISGIVGFVRSRNN